MKKVVKLATGVALVVLLLVGGVETKYWGRIYPGVKFGEVDLGRMEADTALRAIERVTGEMNQIRLVRGVNRWVIKGGDVGWTYDAQQTAGRALGIGRTGGVIANLGARYRAWKQGEGVEPVYSLDENQLEATIASVSAQINIPAKEPTVTINRETGRVEVSQGEDGQEVDERELKQKIRAAIKQIDGQEIEIPILMLRPKLTEERLVRARERAEAIFDKTIKLQLVETGEEWKLEGEQILAWLDPQHEGWKTREIGDFVDGLAVTVDRPAQNASFRFLGSGKVEEFKPAKNGHRIKRWELATLIEEKLAELEANGEGEASITVPVVSFEPEVKTGQVNDLGIKELLGKGESWFAGSITNRIFNLKRAAEMLNGVLVPPGETFSFNKTVGEVSAATGYKQAYVIKEGRTILGDGGGVCQTSTTLFRAILAAGLPIMERVAHAYRVSYYEQNYQVGFDATVFQPAPDLKFTNDTGAYVLIQTEFDEKQKRLAFYLYGTSDGRKAEISKARVWDVVAPLPDLYIDDPTLAAGKIVQTEHRANGAKVAFDWKVTRGDEVLQERTFYSVYRSWQAVYLRGTKTN